MLSILNIFGKSPFAPLECHMEKVAECIHLLQDLFAAIEKKDYEAIDRLVTQICEQEHNADMLKNDIRNHLPKSLFLAIDRGDLLNILGLQDSIADRAEDIAVLVSLKRVLLPDSLKEDFRSFLEKNIETFQVARKIIKEMRELLESTFGGMEAEKVRALVDETAYKEHEADIIQRRLVKGLLNSENEMDHISFFYWEKIFENVASISNLSENLACRVRMTLDLK